MAKEEEIAEKLMELAEQIVIKQPNAESIKDDKDILDQSDRASMRLHNDQYDKLLRDYVENVGKSLETKRQYKKIVVVCSIGIMAAAFLLIIAAVIIMIFLEDTASEMGIAITATASFLTTFIAIPKIIAKYLFNEKEEDSTARIIENIQRHDKEIRDSLYRTKEKDDKEE